MIHDVRNTQGSGENFRRHGKAIHRLCAVLTASVFLAIGQRVHAQNAKFPPWVDRAAIQSEAGPVASQGATGMLGSRSGSRVPEARLLSTSFSFRSGSASVEVVVFPKKYRYAAHDLFGILSKGAPDSFKCGDWVYADGTHGGNICYYVHDLNGQLQKGGAIWFNGNADKGFVTVIIGYTGLTGLPGQVIDQYLREYPSDVPENPTWHHDWETKDIEKWKDILRTSKDDVRMLQAGAVYLMRYDKRSFGLLQALQQRDNPVAFSEALKGVNERMNGWMEHRKKAKESGQRKD